MPGFIYRGLARGASTLVNLDESCNSGMVGVPTGGSGSSYSFRRKGIYKSGQGFEIVRSFGG